MSTLEKIAPDLVIGAVVGSLGSYGLDVLYPSPDRTFLVVACAATVCSRIILQIYIMDYARKLTSDYGYVDKDRQVTNRIFTHLSGQLTAATSFLLPIVALYAGQKAGYRVPDPIQMLGYSAAAGNLFWIAKSTVDLAKDSYYRYYASPAVK